MSTMISKPRPRREEAPEAVRHAVDVLARTLYGEARGESVRGKEAVAAVIMNRVQRARDRGGYWWGDTVESVCQRAFQFSCWNEGDPNRAKLLAATPRIKTFASCLRIARRAVAGRLKDPVRGATHYHSAAIRPRWAKGRTACTAIGNHLFYNTVE